MAEAKLQVLGPYDAWHGAAYRGSLSLGGDVRAVLLLLGPEGAAGDALNRARAAAATTLAVRGEGVLPLLGVERCGSRVAWVYEHVDALGLGHSVGSEGNALLSTRAAAEVVARVAETLVRLGVEGHRNRGPEPTDLLLDPRGRLWVTGFAGPFPSPPSMRAPRGEEGEAAVVYRLGVLLAHLVSGVAPSAASERSAHAALIRRALIRAMARPGPVLTERYGDWLRGMLAWEPTERPPLSTVPDGLRKVADSTGGETLAEWAAANVTRLARVAETAGETDRATRPAPRPTVTEEPSEGPTTEEVGAAPPPRRVPVTPPITPVSSTGPAELDAFVSGNSETMDDDPTQEAASLVPTLLARALVPPARPVVPAASIPVRVGPPPEAIREPPRLPSGFLDPGTDVGEEEEPSGPPAWARVLLLLMWLAAIGFLLSAAVVLAAYLVFAEPNTPPPPAVPDEPELSDVLGAAPADAVGGVVGAPAATATEAPP